MANVKACDICMSKGKLTKAAVRSRVTGIQGLALDQCRECAEEFKRDHRTVDVAYVQYVYKILYGIDIGATEAQAMLKRR